MNSPEHISTNSHSPKLKKFKRREWLLTIALLLVVEAWLLSTSASLSSQQDILNYISFASTITSLILAVIAIIFSVVQNESNHRSSGAIAHQIDDLRRVSGQLQTSRSQLEGQLNRVDAFAFKLDNVHTAVTGSQALLTNISETVSGLKPSSEIPTTAVNKLDSLKTLIRNILRRSTFEADAMSYVLRKFFTKDKIEELPFTVFITKYFALPLSQIDTELTKTDQLMRQIALFQGGFQLLAVLRAFGAVDFKGGVFTATPEAISAFKTLGQEVDEARHTTVTPLLNRGLDLIDRAFSES